jgi:hypothetical protein
MIGCRLTGFLVEFSKLAAYFRFHKPKWLADFVLLSQSPYLSGPLRSKGRLPMDFAGRMDHNLQHALTRPC